MTNTGTALPVDGALGDQGQEERHEAAVRAGGAAAPMHDGEDVRDLAQQARERLVRVLRKRPEQPSAAEVQEHEISGHEPYRSLCRACVAGRGRADGPRRVFPSLELTTATCGAEHQRRQMRHMMRLQARIRQMESELRRQCFVEGAAWIGGCLVIFARQKGTTSEHVTCWQKSCKLGATPVVVRSDGELALLAHVRAARAMTMVSDVPLESVHEQVSKEQKANPRDSRQLGVAGIACSGHDQLVSAGARREDAV